MPITLDEAREHIGRRVIYRPPGQDTYELGAITSVSMDFVFVQYEGDEHSKATSPWMLDWAPEPAPEFCPGSADPRCRAICTQGPDGKILDPDCFR